MAAAQAAETFNSFFLKPTNEEWVMSNIKQMKTSKALGQNSVPINIIKISQQIIV